MSTRIHAAVGAAIVAGLALAAGSQPASAHGPRYYRDPPPVIVVPPGYHAAPYPYWYYGRRVHPRRHGPPPVFVVPGPDYHYRPPPGRHHYRHRPGFSFSFRY